MQNPINLTPITQLIQQIRSAEQTQSKEVKIPIQQARTIVLALTEMQDKLLSDYETMFNALRRSVETEVVTVSMDGGGFEDKK
jgi:hypothetical protein